MSEKEFESFAPIGRLNQNITITEKIHGTNAQILIEDGKALAGSRTRWIFIGADNYGFAAWVAENEAELVEKLGEGRHYGEWYGSGINAGYGMSERRFALFNTYRWAEPFKQGLLPKRVDVVPVLYSGPNSSGVIDDVFNALKARGSVLVPGYVKPEGIVIRWDTTGVMMKRTFESEDAAWTYRAKRHVTPEQAELDALCAPYWQPMRLEKLLSRDERLALEYPKSLPELVKEYVNDLVNEAAVPLESLKFVKKGSFAAVKGMMAERGYSA